MTLPNAILFPDAMLPLYIFEPRYRRMLSDALHSNRMFSVAMQKPGRTRETPCAVAGLGIIRASVSAKDGTSRLILQGVARVELAEAVRYKPYRVQRIQAMRTAAGDKVIVDALTAKVFELVEQRLKQGTGLPFPIQPKLPSGSLDGPLPTMLTVKQLIDHLRVIGSADRLADLVSCTLLTEPAQRQIILETACLETRLKHLIHFLIEEIRRHGRHRKKS